MRKSCQDLESKTIKLKLKTRKWLLPYQNLSKKSKWASSQSWNWTKRRSKLIHWEKSWKTWRNNLSDRKARSWSSQTAVTIWKLQITHRDSVLAKKSTKKLHERGQTQHLWTNQVFLFLLKTNQAPKVCSRPHSTQPRSSLKKTSKPANNSKIAWRSWPTRKIN